MWGLQVGDGFVYWSVATFEEGKLRRVSLKTPAATTVANRLFGPTDLARWRVRALLTVLGEEFNHGHLLVVPLR